MLASPRNFNLKQVKSGKKVYKLHFFFSEVKPCMDSTWKICCMIFTIFAANKCKK